MKGGQLTSLVGVPIRDVWASEPQGFTPWLLEHGDLLGELLGLDDLELQAAEHAVGSFSLDLIGRTTRHDEVVIVENQFGPTDHGHLGQIMTYAGGTQPNYVVWIAETFRDEHRAALDWLNLRTDSETRFFGIELKVVTLVGAEHLQAPLFEVVVKPNEWGKAVRPAPDLSPNAEAYLAFWSIMMGEMRDRGWTTSKGTTRDSWVSLSAKAQGASYTIQFTRAGLTSELRLEHPDAELNTVRFNALLARRAEIDAKYGASLIFDPLPQYKLCKIYDLMPDVSISDRDEWETIRSWALDSQTRLRAAISAAGGVPHPRSP